MQVEVTESGILARPGHLLSQESQRLSLPRPSLTHTTPAPTIGALPS
jgi:hypothetical protein